MAREMRDAMPEDIEWIEQIEELIADSSHPLFERYFRADDLERNAIEVSPC